MKYLSQNNNNRNNNRNGVDSGLQEEFCIAMD